MFRTINEIDTPAILIEKSVMEENLRLMQAIADKHNVNLRVHIKTHKIPELAKIQLKAGAVGIAVAKLGEAEVMADHGIKDLQIANIIVGKDKISQLAALGRRCRISVAVDSLQNAKELSFIFSSQRKVQDVLVKIDTGLGRCGLADFADVARLVIECRKLNGIRIIGLMTHAGHAYGAPDRKKISQIGRMEGEKLVEFAEKLRKLSHRMDVVSVGSTPTAGYCSKVRGVTELRVGNYIFNDMTQVALGSVPKSRCALTVLATVISRPTDDRAIIDSGSKALALDRGAHGKAILTGFGGIIGGGGVLARLSEEHGIIENLSRKFKIGEKIRIIPNHACTTVNLYDYAYLVDDGRVLKKYNIAARGKIN